MEALTKWLSENSGALWTMIVSFLSANGIVLIVNLVNMVKNRIEKAKLIETMSETQKANYEKIEQSWKEFEASMTEVVKSSNAERLQKQKEFIEQLQKMNDKITDVEVLEDEDVINTLDSLE